MEFGGAGRGGRHIVRARRPLRRGGIQHHRPLPQDDAPNDNNNNNHNNANHNADAGEALQAHEDVDGDVVMQDVEANVVGAGVAVPAAVAAAAAAADNHGDEEEAVAAAAAVEAPNNNNFPPPQQPRHNVEQDEDDNENAAAVRRRREILLEHLMHESDDDDDDDDLDDLELLIPNHRRRRAGPLLIEGGVAEPDPADATEDTTANNTNNRLAANADITLFFTCTDPALFRQYPDHPILQSNVRVSIGMGKNTKLRSVFKRYLEVCNDPKYYHKKYYGRQPPPMKNRPPKLEWDDLEFVHCQLLDGSNTAEGAAVMKNDVIDVRKNRRDERQFQKERDRFQREMDMKFVSFMQQQFQSHEPDTSLRCCGTLEQLHEELPESSVASWQPPPSPPPASQRAPPPPRPQKKKRPPPPSPSSTPSTPASPPLPPPYKGSFRSTEPPLPGSSSTRKALKRSWDTTTAWTTQEDREKDNNTTTTTTYVPIKPKFGVSGPIYVPCHSFLVQQRCPWLGDIIRRHYVILAEQKHQLEQEPTRIKSQGKHDIDNDTKEKSPDGAAPMVQLHANDDEGDNRPNHMVAVVPSDANLDGDDNVESTTEDGWDVVVEHVVDETKSEGGKSVGEKDESQIVALPSETKPSSTEIATATQTKKKPILDVTLDHPVEAVRLLMEYIYTNRVVSLGYDAFVTACKTKPTHDKGPVLPHSTGGRSSRRNWPNRGDPTVSFDVAAATIVLAEHAKMPRLSLMAEVAAANLVSPTLVVHALTLCQKMKSDFGNELPRLCKATLEVVLRSAKRGDHPDRSVWVLPSFRQELQEKKNLLVPALITGTVEVLEDAAKAASVVSPKTLHRGALAPPVILQHDPVAWRTKLLAGFREIDQQDHMRRLEERRKRALDRIAARSIEKIGEEDDNDNIDDILRKPPVAALAALNASPTTRSTASANANKRPRRSSTNTKQSTSLFGSRTSRRQSKRGPR